MLREIVEVLEAYAAETRGDPPGGHPLGRPLHSRLLEVMARESPSPPGFWCSATFRSGRGARRPGTRSAPSRARSPRRGVADEIALDVAPGRTRAGAFVALRLDGPILGDAVHGAAARAHAGTRSSWRSCVDLVGRPGRRAPGEAAAWVVRARSRRARRGACRRHSAASSSRASRRARRPTTTEVLEAASAAGAEFATRGRRGRRGYDEEDAERALREVALGRHVHPGGR